MVAVPSALMAPLRRAGLRLHRGEPVPGRVDILRVCAASVTRHVPVA